MWDIRVMGVCSSERLTIASSIERINHGRKKTHFSHQIAFRSIYSVHHQVNILHSNTDGNSKVKICYLSGYGLTLPQSLVYVERFLNC